jgi:oxygen-independent coproporphyrinogen III oxidase
MMNLDNLPQNSSRMIMHLYVHIPFCPKVCPYCSFYKEASDRNKTRCFLDAVLAEADRHACQLTPQTIFFGGGTPTALSTSQLEYLIGGLRERVNLSDLQEFTVEMNPATVSLEKAGVLRKLGVNRVSMGVQSWDAGLLATLGRVHSASQAQRSYEILREAGFENINLDLIFGVPGQTCEQWRASLEKTIALNPSHISAYCLTYEEDTEYFLRMSRGEYQPDESLDADLFEMTIDTLENAGFCQYEISNYSRPGRECRHNLAYWLGADFLGLGPSAFSTVGLDRWKNVSETNAYVSAIEAGGDPADFREALTARTRQVECIAFSLRTDRGVPSDFLPSSEAEALANIGLLARGDGRWHLTRKGKLLADSVAEAFI